jgi:short-subunit dehydrogenase
MGQVKVALITGASSGLGREFARQIDAAGLADEIWLVARRQDKLEQLAATLVQSKGVPLAADLTRASEVAAIGEQLARTEPDLVALVNNAGIGLSGRFSDLGLDEQLQMLDLNVRALTQLTHLALPHMNRGALLIQVASVVGLLPAAGWSAYAASKAYVISLAASLSGELEERGIHCSACLPGPMRTEFYDRSGSVQEVPLFVDPAQVAALALRHARRGKIVSIKGASLRLAALLSRILPRRFFIWATARMLKKQLASKD